MWEKVSVFLINGTVEIGLRSGHLAQVVWIPTCGRNSHKWKSEKSYSFFTDQSHKIKNQEKINMQREKVEIKN